MSREKVNELTNALQAKEKEDHAAQENRWKEINSLQQQKQEAIRKLLLEENLLNLCTWQLIVDRTYIYLAAYEASDHRKVKPLSALTETEHHCSFPLVVEPDEDNRYIDSKEVVSLHYDDNEITIRFDHHCDIADFLVKYKIKVNTERVDKEIKRLEESVLILQALRKLVI